MNYWIAQSSDLLELPVVWQPALSISAVISLAIFGLGLCLWSYWRFRTFKALAATLLRFVMVVLTALLLLGPSKPLPQNSNTQTKPQLHILLDESASMGMKDINGQSRFSAITTQCFTAHSLNQLEELADVHWHLFAQNLRHVDGQTFAGIQPNGRQTLLYESLQSQLNQLNTQTPTTILLISDGNDTSTTSASDTIDLALAKQVKLHVMPIGKTQPVKDIALSVFATPGRIFDEQPVTFNINIRQQGYTNQTIELNLLHKGQRVQSVSVPLNNRPTTSITLKHQPPKNYSDSLLHYSVHVTPLADEATTTNNQRDCFVERIGRRLRVVYFEGQPYWDTKYLIKALRDNPRIELTTIQALRPGRIETTLYRQGNKTEGDPSFDDKQLMQYDVIILGRSVEQFFPSDRVGILHQFVTQHGGGLMFARGRAFSKNAINQVARKIIAPLESVDWADQYVYDLQLGLAPQQQILPENVSLYRMPHAIGATKHEGLKAASIALLTQRPSSSNQPESAAAAYQQIGSGRTLSLLTDGLWRWAMLPSDRGNQSIVYRQFIQSCVTWLALGDDFFHDEQVTLYPDQFTQSLYQMVQLNVRTANQSALKFLENHPILSVIQPDGKTTVAQLYVSPTDPAKLTAAYLPTEPGVYQVSLSIDNQPITQTMFAAYDTADEKLNTSAQHAAMLHLAKQTAGSVIDYQHPEQLLTVLQQAKQKQQLTQANATGQFVPLWAKLWFFILLVVLLTGEWLLRRWEGLP